MLPAPRPAASRRAFTVAALTFALGATAALAAAPRQAPAALPAAPAPIELFDGACLGTNPYFATTAYARGGERDHPAVMAFRNSLPDNPAAEEDHPVLAIQRQVGATYGMGYEPESRSLFVAAYHKRGTPFGPGGPGAIYRIDLTTGNTAPWLTVPGAGTDMHENRQDDYWPDNRARNGVGVLGLGDLDVGPGGRELYVMHLPERQIYRYNIADKKLLGKIPHGGAKEPWAAEARPFALAIHDDKLYHGVVSSAYKSQELTDLVAHVYESELDGSQMREVLRMDLGYDRGSALSTRGPGVSARWQPWKDGYNDSGGGNGRFGYGIYPMPMLTDIEFTATQNMVLGFRDRNGDMTFYDPGGRNPPGEGTGIPSGDIVLARRAGDAWTADPAPEFYRNDDSPRNQTVHGESSFGGLGKVPLADVVMMTGLAPLRISSGGGFWFDNTDGGDVGREELYDYESEVNFGKANGLGDVEVLCGPVIATPTPTVTDTATATDTATVTPTATDTATPRATETATLTPTPRVYRIYLPFTTKAEVCVPDAYHTDVVLVLDRSTSMLRSVEDGGAQKNEAAIAAAKQFVATLDFTPDALGRHDQVAVVGFNDLAWTEHDLTNDLGAALGALDAIRTKTQEGTRLDLGMLEGQKPLDGPRHKPENRPVIILLTDGLPNRVPTPAPSGRQEDTVLAAATAAKARGTRVYTIALGKPTDIMPRLMWQMSSEKWMYYYVPRPEDLAGIYDQLAHTFDECGPHAWPTPTPCVADINHADIVLVLDMSTSMYRETSAGRSKQAAAIEAARVFVGALDLEVDGWGRQDQAAIVGFNGSGWIQVPMTADREALNRGLDALPARSAEGTRLDLAFRVGQQAMEDPRRLPENAAVMIMLTDGLPNQVPPPPGGSQEDTVRAAAAAAKARGSKVYTVGLGAPEDIDEALLAECASEASLFYYAPDGEDLARIYREIAGRISACRPE